MDKASKDPKSAPVKPEQFKDEREQRGAPTAPTSADQLGATEHDVMPLTPPTNDKPADQARLSAAHKPADQARPSASEKHKAADEIDPADELTPG